LTYPHTEAQGRTSADRKAVFDLHDENEKGERFIIELQNIRQLFSGTEVFIMSLCPCRIKRPEAALGTNS